MGQIERTVECFVATIKLGHLVLNPFPEGDDQMAIYA